MPSTTGISGSESLGFVRFDTHKHIKELKASGFKEKQAEILVDSMLAAAQGNDLSKLATKEQVANLEKATKEQITNLEMQITKLDGRMTNLEKQVGNVEKGLEKCVTHDQFKAEIHRMKYTLIRWMAGLLGGFAAAMGGIAWFVIQEFIKFH